MCVGVSPSDTIFLVSLVSQSMFLSSQMVSWNVSLIISSVLYFFCLEHLLVWYYPPRLSFSPSFSFCQSSFFILLCVHFVDFLLVLKSYIKVLYIKIDLTLIGNSMNFNTCRFIPPSSLPPQAGMNLLLNLLPKFLFGNLVFNLTRFLLFSSFVSPLPPISLVLAAFLVGHSTPGFDCRVDGDDVGVGSHTIYC